MNGNSWRRWAFWRKPATIRKQAPAKRRLSLGVELLEDRCVPTTSIVEYPVVTSPSSPMGITSGPDGNVWFTEEQAGQIGMINPTTHAVTEFATPTASSGPLGITAGPDGNIWFTESGASKIGVFNLTTDKITEFPTPTANSGPMEITAGPDGNLWFTEFNANKIGVITTAGAITEIPIPTANSNPTGIAAGPDGNLWFTESGTDKIATIDPTVHTITEYKVPKAASQPYEIIAGSNGNMWFTENAGNVIGEISTTNHAFSAFAVPTVNNSGPYGITSGADGNIWFVENNGDRIGEVSIATGLVTQTAIPTAGANPTMITAGPGGTLWFTEPKGNQIGEVVASPVITTQPTNQTIAVGQPASITANAVGFPWPSVQWEFSTNNGITFAPIGNGGIYSGANTGTLSISDVSSGMNGYLYEAVFSNGVAPTATTTAALLTLATAPTITADPVNQKIVAGLPVSFSAGATGVPAPTVQWLVSSNSGSSFAPITNGPVYSGATTGTLTITGATTAMTGYEYEAVFSNGVLPNATTTAAILTVVPLLTITPANPQGIVAIPYNQTLTVGGSTSPFITFTVSGFNAGSTGLTGSDVTANSGSGTIVISGTPTATGTASFIVTAADTAGGSLTQTVDIVIQPPLAITTASPLPNATAGASYSQTIGVIGGILPYTTFSVSGFSAGGTGLTASNITANSTAGTVVVSGKPTAAGTVSFTVNVTDSAGTSVSQAYTITVNPPLAITPSLPAGTAETAYSQTITVTGGGLPYATFSAGPLSAGTTGLIAADVTTDASAGTITIAGTPTGAGTASFVVNVVDADGAALTKTFTIKINAPLGMTASLPQGTAGATYNHAVTITGGTTPYTVTTSGFSGGTTGLTATNLAVNATAGTVVLNGTPTAAGTISFTVNVTDAAGSTLDKTYSITINPAPAIANITAGVWTATKSGFPATLTITGGTAPFSIASVTGLPTGMGASLNGSTLGFVGTPTAAGTFIGTITIHDAAGASVTKIFGITVNAAPTIGNLTVTQWTAGRAGFGGVLIAGGGTGALTLSGSAGVPAGMRLVMTGDTISFTGTPTTAGTFTGSVTVHDTLGAAVSKTFSITINPPPSIGSLTNTQWTVSKPGFAGTLPITGGTGPFTITHITGLPAGVTAAVSGAAISFSGTPTAAGVFSGSVTVQDSTGASATQTFSITINPPLSIVTTTLAAARMGMPYTGAILFAGGTGADTVKITKGSLPPGYMLSSTGAITGVSRGFGSFTFTVTVTDAIGDTVSGQFTVTIALL